MTPPEDVLTGPPSDAGDGARMGVLDMSRCALFVYVDLDGRAVAQAEGVAKPEAAKILRQIAELWDGQR
ncbi:hypothetical protein [Nocardia sp. N2S4-5]|uniref:hypothetical protein n=1 Tax=Nocardia sp. N2S4-5 TaxID=3351565 RepID=UPI0037D0B20D